MGCSSLTGKGIFATIWYDAEEKSDRRSNILIIRRYFPQIQLREFPKMAHAELVMMYPEEFCRYTEEFLTGQAV